MCADVTEISALVLSALAIVVSGFSFFYTQGRMDRREIEKWRRDELLRLTNSILEISRRRQSVLYDDLTKIELNGTFLVSREELDFRGSTHQMRVCADQIRLLDPNLADTADTLVALFQKADECYSPHEDHYSEIESLLVDEKQLEAVRADLVRSCGGFWRGHGR
ncbi:hypothetical protein EEB14_59390 [Rhodococcus sp. WS4]|nr:hypothetical protein EEB14_59390 [Rhodococcus sp. WS4]